MKCKKVRKSLIKYLNKQVDDLETKEIRNHVTLCQRCARELSTLSEIWERLDSFEDLEPSPSFRRVLREKIREKRHKKGLLQIFRPILRPLPVGVAVMILSGFITTYYLQLNSYMINQTEFTISNNLDLLVDYEIINNIDILEDFDVIKNIDL